MIHNTGRIRLHPTVKINGKAAKGPGTVLSRSVEKYVLTQPVPIWGGPVSSNVAVDTTVDRVGRQEPGPSRRASASTFVIPYLLFIALAVLAGLFVLARWLWRKRGGKYAALQAEVRRFERMLAQPRSGDFEGDIDDPEIAIKQAIKQAGRAGDTETEEKLKEKLAEFRHLEDASPVAPAPVPVNGTNGANGEGVAGILRELANTPPGGRRFALVRQARSHGRQAIEAHPDELAALPEDLRQRLLRSSSAEDRQPIA